MSSGWKMVQLGDILRAIEAGRSPQAENRQPQAGERAVLKVSAVRAGVFDSTEAKTLAPGTEMPSRALIKDGDILMTRANTAQLVGAVCQVVGSFEGLYLCDKTLRLVATDDVDPRFLVHALAGPLVRQQLLLAATGTSGSMKNISQDKIRALQLPLPSMREQRRIADLLGVLDLALVGAQDHVKAAAALSAQLRRRLVGHRDAPMISLRDAVEVTMGRQRSPKHQTGDHIVPYLRAGNVKNGYLALEDVLQMNFTPKEQLKYALRPGDVLVTEGCGSLGQIGANAVWQGQIAEPVCFQNTLLRLRAIDGLTLQAFVSHWARYAFESGAFADVASGTNIFHIGAERAAVMSFPRLSVERQAEIADVLDDAENVSAAARARVEELKSLRTATRTSLLNQTHTIPDSYDRLLPDENPADADLEPVTV